MNLKIGDIYREVKSLNEAEMKIKELFQCGWHFSATSVVSLSEKIGAQTIATIYPSRLLKEAGFIKDK